MTTDETPQCTATSTQSGKRCRNRPMAGTTVCSTHGGLSPQVRAKAAERLLEARVAGEIAKRGWEPVTDPLGAFADLVGEVWAFKELCREKLAELRTWDYEDLKGGQDIRPVVAVYERALDRAGKQLVDMLRIGLTADALRTAKERPSREQADALGNVLDRVLGALELTAEQRDRVPAALADALKREGLL